MKDEEIVPTKPLDKDCLRPVGEYLTKTTKRGKVTTGMHFFDDRSLTVSRLQLSTKLQIHQHTSSPTACYSELGHVNRAV